MMTHICVTRPRSVKNLTLPDVRCLQPTSDLDTSQIGKYPTKISNTVLPNSAPAQGPGLGHNLTLTHWVQGKRYVVKRKSMFSCILCMEFLHIRWNFIQEYVVGRHNDVKSPLVRVCLVPILISNCHMAGPMMTLNCSTRWKYFEMDRCRPTVTWRCT